MVRLEIVGNVSLEEDLMDSLKEANLDFYYTSFSQVKGKGEQGQKRSDGIWPEENFLMIAYLGLEEARKICKVVYDVKCRFPKEGLNVFMVEAMQLDEPDRVREAQRKANQSLLELEEERD